MNCLTRLATGICLAAPLVFLTGCHQEAPAQNASGPATPVVSVVSPSVTTIRQTTTQPATVHAFHEAQLFAKTSGYLAKLNVDIGATVEEGQVLGVVAVPEMEKSREKHEADIRRLVAEEGKAAAAVKLATAQVTSSKAALDRARADVSTATARLAADKSEFDRVTNLVEQKAVAARLLDEAKQKLESSVAAKSSAEAALQSAAAAVSVSEQQEAVARAEVDAAKAQTDVARRALDELDALMGYATLKAPFAGVITERNVDPGDLIRNVQTSSSEPDMPLFAVAQVDKVRVRVAIPENQAPWANAGDTVSITLRALPGRSFTGEIRRTTKQLDEATRTMLAEVDLPNEDGLLLPGMYGEATINLEETPNATMLPATAVRFDETGNSSVFVVDSNSTVGIIPVKTGYDDGKQIQILSDLDSSARVIDGSLKRFKGGEKVSVQ